MAKSNGKQATSNGTTKNFKGTIKLDVRDSKADWSAFLDTRTLLMLTYIYKDGN